MSGAAGARRAEGTLRSLCPSCKASVCRCGNPIPRKRLKVSDPERDAQEAAGQAINVLRALQEHLCKAGGASSNAGADSTSGSDPIATAVAERASMTGLRPSGYSNVVVSSVPRWPVKAAVEPRHRSPPPVPSDDGGHGGDGGDYCSDGSDDGVERCPSEDGNGAIGVVSRRDQGGHRRRDSDDINSDDEAVATTITKNGGGDVEIIDLTDAGAADFTYEDSDEDIDPAVEIAPIHGDIPKTLHASVLKHKPLPAWATPHEFRPAHSHGASSSSSSTSSASRPKGFQVQARDSAEFADVFHRLDKKFADEDQQALGHCDVHCSDTRPATRDDVGKVRCQDGLCAKLRAVYLARRPFDGLAMATSESRHLSMLQVSGVVASMEYDISRAVLQELTGTYSHGRDSVNFSTVKVRVSA